MTKEQLEHANNLKNSMNTIVNLRTKCIGYPYPEMYGKVKKHGKWFRITDSGFCYNYTGSDYYELSFVRLDDTTRDQLKSAIREVLDRRYSEIQEELKNM